MQLQQLTKHFERIGAKLEVDLVPPTQGRFSRVRPDFSIDIIEEKNNERYLLEVQKSLENTLSFSPLDVRPKERHLLLYAHNPNANTADLQKQKFLCGHDERHWFVAAIPNARGITNVTNSMEALKPFAARFSQRRNKVRKKNRNKRRNAGFVRQGEWFFIPITRFKPDMEYAILYNEPLIREQGNKPHFVDEIYRMGGSLVYVCWKYPNGIGERAYKKLLQTNAKAKRWNWRSMRRNPRVYARGRVRHADHKTILLDGWHQVVMNQEFATGSVAFLD